MYKFAFMTLFPEGEDKTEQEEEEKEEECEEEEEEREEEEKEEEGRNWWWFGVSVSSLKAWTLEPDLLAWSLSFIIRNKIPNLPLLQFSHL